MAPKTPWGINIAKKNKKAAPRAFGVRLEQCPPAAENQVGPPCPRREAGHRGQGCRELGDSAQGRRGGDGLPAVARTGWQVAPSLTPDPPVLSVCP